MLENLNINDEATELYKRFIYDYEKLTEDEKIARNIIGNINLKITYLDCLFELAKTHIKLKENFLAYNMLKKYLELENETKLKSEALVYLMKLFNDESDHEKLRETILEYEKLNPSSDEFDDYEEIINYKSILLSNTPYTKMSEKEKFFPFMYSVHGVKFTRIDDNIKHTINGIECILKIENDNYETSINYISLATLRNPESKIKLALAFHYPIEKVSRKSPKKIVYATLLHNIRKIATLSIFTEFPAAYRTYKIKRDSNHHDSFVIDDIECEFYLVDYSNADSCIDKWTGFIRLTDENIKDEIK